MFDQNMEPRWAQRQGFVCACAAVPFGYGPRFCRLDAWLRVRGRRPCSPAKRVIDSLDFDHRGSLPFLAAAPALDKSGEGLFNVQPGARILACVFQPPLPVLLLSSRSVPFGRGRVVVDSRFPEIPGGCTRLDCFLSSGVSPTHCHV